MLRGVPAGLRDDVRANVASRREFRAMHTTLSDTLPAWRIVAPAPAEAAADSQGTAEGGRRHRRRQAQ